MIRPVARWALIGFTSLLAAAALIVLAVVGLLLRGPVEIDYLTPILEAALSDIEPEIWRQVDVPLGLSLKGLHDVIQAAFGWLDYHLHEFRVGDKIYGVPAPDGEDYGRKVLQDKLIKIDALIAKGHDSFEYSYDFGDNWEHFVEIEQVMDADPGTKYPRFVAGERRAPPEDVGGFPGYYEFIAAIKNKRHPEHKQMLQWCGGSYDPDDIDLFRLRMRLGAIAKRRHAGKLAYQKSAHSG